MVTVCPSQFATRRTLFHVLVGCGLLMLRSEERFSRNAETDLVCRLLLEKKKEIWLDARDRAPNTAWLNSTCRRQRGGTVRPPGRVLGRPLARAAIGGRWRRP